MSGTIRLASLRAGTKKNLVGLRAALNHVLRFIADRINLQFIIVRSVGSNDISPITASPLAMASRKVDFTTPAMVLHPGGMPTLADEGVQTTNAYILGMVQYHGFNVTRSPEFCMLKLCLQHILQLKT